MYMNSSVGHPYIILYYNMLKYYVQLYYVTVSTTRIVKKACDLRVFDKITCTAVHHLQLRLS